MNLGSQPLKPLRFGKIPTCPTWVVVRSLALEFSKIAFKLCLISLVEKLDIPKLWKLKVGRYSLLRWSNALLAFHQIVYDNFGEE